MVSRVSDVTLTTHLGARLEPSVLIRAPSTTKRRYAADYYRGARIRTGDLCDPNAALYRTEPHPEDLRVGGGRGGIELRSPPAILARLARHPSRRSATTPSLARLDPRSARVRTGGLKTHGRGGIRTHAGFRPHDFQSCALSHSATRPKKWPRLAARQPRTEGVGLICGAPRLDRLARPPPRLPPINSFARSARPTLADPRPSVAGAPGSNITAKAQRREWDSNPRGP